jgi:TatD DNase family protein
MIDTHSHIYLKEFDEDREDMLQRASQTGITDIYMPNIDEESVESMLAVESSATHPVCHAMMGIHPCSVSKDYQKQMSFVEDWFAKRDFCAVGEIGIDLYWDKSLFEEQKKAFQHQISLALDVDRPIVIHSRESLDITIEMVENNQNGKLRGVFHCFSGTHTQLQKIIDLGFMIGIGGVLTYKKAGLKELLNEFKPKNIILETDAPYLSPVPFRGKRNEPSYLKHVLLTLSEIYEDPEDKIIEMTTSNAKIHWLTNHYSI